MCGRYTLSVSNRPELKAVGLQVVDRYNIAPQSEVLVYDSERQLQQMRWDYSPPWAQKPLHLTNARSETLREKPAFRGAMRCVFLADGWYEWQQQGKRKVPYYHHANGELIYFAGIYNRQSGCAIVTRESRENIAFVHHRQPVLLDARAIAHWLAGHDLFASAITQSIHCYPVSTAVNQPGNDYPSLIQRVDASAQINTVSPSVDASPNKRRQKSSAPTIATQKTAPPVSVLVAPNTSASDVNADKPLQFGESGDLFD